MDGWKMHYCVIQSLQCFPFCIRIESTATVGGEWHEGSRRGAQTTIEMKTAFGVSHQTEWSRRLSNEQKPKALVLIRRRERGIERRNWRLSLFVLLWEEEEECVLSTRLSLAFALSFHLFHRSPISFLPHRPRLCGAYSIQHNSRKRPCARFSIFHRKRQSSRYVPSILWLTQGKEEEKGNGNERSKAVSGRRAQQHIHFSSPSNQPTSFKMVFTCICVSLPPFSSIYPTKTDTNSPNIIFCKTHKGIRHYRKNKINSSFPSRRPFLPMTH